MTTKHTMNSLKLAAEMVERKRDEAARYLARLLAQEEHAKAQLDQLQTYALEKDRRWLSDAQSGRAVVLMQHHYQFVQRLHDAIGMQSQVLVRQGDGVQEARSHLLTLEQRLATLNQAMDRFRVQIQQKKEKHEQKQTDEMATRAYLKNKGLLEIST